MVVAQVLPTLAATTPSPSIFSTVMAACTDDDEKLVASALLVASTPQKHRDVIPLDALRVAAKRSISASILLLWAQWAAEKSPQL